MEEEYKITAKLEVDEAQQRLDAFMEQIKEAISLVDELTSKMRGLVPLCDLNLKIDVADKTFEQITPGVSEAIVRSRVKDSDIKNLREMITNDDTSQG